MSGLNIPESIKKLVGTAPFTTDAIGMSGASVRLYPDAVLKTARDDESARREAGIMAWLHGRLPVPEILACVRENGLQYLLMTRLPGKMLCDGSLLAQPHRVTGLLARALEAVGAVDAAGCPFRADLDVELSIARRHVERGEVEVENTDPATFGPGGFRNPEHLLLWLEANRPEEELRFTHGDMCLPNLFTENGRLTGFLDLGGAGLGDPYRDYAIARRSLQDNLDGHHGRACPGFDADALFEALGLTPDREKLRYYALLDELF